MAVPTPTERNSKPVCNKFKKTDSLYTISITAKPKKIANPSGHNRMEKTAIVLILLTITTTPTVCHSSRVAYSMQTGIKSFLLTLEQKKGPTLLISTPVIYKKQWDQRNSI
jgi:hypothetical protein